MAAVLPGCGCLLMGAVMTERLPFDLERYVRERAQGPCFICAMLRGEPGYHHHRIAEDEDTVLFLSKFPTQPGYGLVCPKRHVEDLADRPHTLDLLELLHEFILEGMKRTQPAAMIDPQSAAIHRGIVKGIRDRSPAAAEQAILAHMNLLAQRLHEAPDHEKQAGD